MTIIEKRIFQLMKEAVEEMEKYGSCQSAYYMLKYILSQINDHIQSFPDYDIPLDNLILLSFNETLEEKKYKFFVKTFLVYDYLSTKYTVQDPIFIFRWGKLYFIYSPRIDAHLSLLEKNSFLTCHKFQLKLTRRGKEERENIIQNLSDYDLNKINELDKQIEEFKLQDLKIFMKKYLFEKGNNYSTIME
ncbi:hypothetical protein [Sulfolobus acidocaldarius]|nr:hypothetical protein [Sulfolobus acidocaldarius]AGE71190.1 hypothetical protein SacN8_06125 [Sulfolobus acidocaldarius N8]AGE73460.1 hypothetical protein SacRon12I_06120 [Sulfolobus acidocaldarius Ron12/I]WCM35122.1 hypothetical protein GO597_07135 [Sulfolobus acidocaldarius DSM 639]ALU28544.1 hypothetical protein ATY89_00230 [Sulfolobus acidocaldarius]ALU31255.1 hypothetical protein ATZ20_03275 [Sulfolobus acidocaldarius]